MTKEAAWALADDWVAAWNAHDLDAIISHYDDHVELISPVAAQLLGRTDGKVSGKADLRSYFQRGLEAYPDLHFTLHDVRWGQTSLIALYTNHKDVGCAEFMRVTPSGQVDQVIAHYNA